MDQKEAIGALIGTATIVGFGYCACKYLDKMSDVKAVEHFNVLRKPSQTKKSASAASAKPKRSAPKKPALKNKKERFSSNEKHSMEFLTGSSRFGVNTRQLINYRDIRPMPYIKPAPENSIPFGGSGNQEDLKNSFSKNIFTGGTGSASAVGATTQVSKFT